MKKKKVSAKRVDDLMRSVFVGRTVLMDKLYARIDKLSFVANLPEKVKKRMLWDRLTRLSGTDRYQIKKHKAGKNECSGLYRNVVKVRLNSCPDDYPSLMVMHFKPSAKNRRRARNDSTGYHERAAVRFEFSPQNYQPHEITRFILWLGEEAQLGDMIYQVLKNAWITRVDYALDILGMRLRDYYLRLSDVSTGEVYDSDNGMEGLRMGNANLIAACYEKVDVRDLSKREFSRASLLELDSREYRDFLRIELRLSPRKEDLRLRDIGNMANLTKRLAFYNTALREDKRLDPAFVALLDMGMSIPQARSGYKPSSVINGKAVSTNKKQAQKRLERLLLKYQEELFNADKLWDKLPELISKLGIIGEPQYWNKKLRDKWLDR